MENAIHGHQIRQQNGSTEQDMVIGEIVEAATTSFVAQCVDCGQLKRSQLFEPPEFGSFIKIKPFGAPPAIVLDELGSAQDDEEADPFAKLSASSPLRQSPSAFTASAGTLYAAVSHASMTTLDAGRRPTALGYADEDELRMHQPQIFELITTEFSGVLLAYSDSNGNLRRALPPRPPRLHSRVFPCTADEVVGLTEDLQFMSRLLSGSIKMDASAHDLAAAILRQGWSARALQPGYLQQAGQQLSALLGGDYEALQTILRSVVA